MVATSKPGKSSTKETPEQRRIRLITTLHGEIIEFGRKSLQKALQAGELLTEQKAEVKEGGGNWMKWVEENLKGFTHRTANNYMRLWKKREEIKLETISNLTDAYRWLRSFGTTPSTKKKVKKKDDADKPAGKKIPLELTEKEGEEFNKLTGKLHEVFSTDNVKDLILNALRMAYKEYIDANDYPSLNISKRPMAAKANGKACKPATPSNGRKRPAA